MIDFLKIIIHNTETIERLKKNGLLNWVQETEKLKHDKETITTVIEKVFDGIKFKFSPDKVEIHFKPHYFYNNNIHNGNDFSIANCISILKDFTTLFNIEPEEAYIVNMEFGINILSPIPIRDLINYIKYQLRNQFVNHTGLKYSKVAASVNSNGKQSGYKQNKVYAKGLQCPEYAYENTFRYEIRTNESKYIKNHLNVTTIKDLLETEPYLKMQQIILREFKDILLLDRYAKLSLTKTEQKRLDELLNEDTWYHLVNDPNRNKFARARKRYYHLINKDENNLKKQLQKLVLDKLELLKSGADSKPLSKHKIGADSNVSIFGYCTTYNEPKPQSKICPITELEISMQKGNSYLLSITGLKYYYKNHRSIYDEIKNKYLSDYWDNADQNTQIKEIAHNIRNTHNNRKRKQQRVYPSHQMQLFDISILKK